MIYQTLPVTFCAKFLYHSYNNKYGVSFHLFGLMQQAFCDILWTPNQGILKCGRHSEKTVLARG